MNPHFKFNCLCSLVACALWPMVAYILPESQLGVLQYLEIYIFETFDVTGDLQLCFGHKVLVNLDEASV